jgi:hypothetical protein
MTRKQALEASIAHWARIVTGHEECRHAANCALCQKYLDNDCVGCPVMERTGKHGCEGTPYEAFIDAVSDEAAQYAGLLWPDSYTVVGPRSQQAAIDEYNFLCSLK